MSSNLTALKQELFGRRITDGYSFGSELYKTEQRILEQNITLLGDVLKKIKEIKPSNDYLDELKDLKDLNLKNISWYQAKVKYWPIMMRNNTIDTVKFLGGMLVLFPFFLPCVLIKESIYTPLYLVFSRIRSVFRIIQEIWGWILFTFILTGIWIIMYHPEFEKERKQFETILEFFASFLVPLEAMKNQLMSLVPNQRFFVLAMETYLNILKTIPSIAMSYFFMIFKELTVQLKNSVTNSIISLIF